MASGNIIRKRQRQSELIRKMVISGMLSAITAILTFTPLGMITLPPPLLPVTTVHIPVILAALVEGPIVGLIVGLVFGVCSLIRSWESGAVGLSLFFRNPLISVLPRLLIPLASIGVYLLLKKLLGKFKWNDKLSAIIASAIGAVTNTVCCLGMIVLVYGNDLSVLVNEMISAGNANAAYVNNAGAWLVAVVGLPNGLMEALAAAIIVPMIKTAVDAVLRRSGRRSRPEQPLQ